MIERIDDEPAEILAEAGLERERLQLTSPYEARWGGADSSFYRIPEIRWELRREDGHDALDDQLERLRARWQRRGAVALLPFVEAVRTSAKAGRRAELTVPDHAYPVF